MNLSRFLFAIALFGGTAALVGAATDKPATTSCCTKDAACCGKDKACCAKEGTATECCDTAQACCEILQSYIPISEALAADDLAKAKAAASVLAKQAESDGLGNLAQAARTLASADGLPAARAAFKTMSTDVVPLAEGAKGFVVMNCPMAKADWVQTDDKVRNPYYGKMMLHCGAPKKAATTP